MASLREHAEVELKAAGFDSKDSIYEGMLYDSVLEIVDTVADQGHSGMSASILISILEKILRYEPLVPLSGEDDEWNEVDDGLYQNKRCSRVFKDEDGAYDIEGKVFIEPNGSAYTSFESRVPVVFPYTPKTEYISVEENLDV